LRGAKQEMERRANGNIYICNLRLEKKKRGRHLYIYILIKYVVILDEGGGREKRVIQM